MVKSNFLSLSVDLGGDFIVCKLEEEELMSTNNSTMWVMITVNIMVATCTGLNWKCYDHFMEKLC